MSPSADAPTAKDAAVTHARLTPDQFAARLQENHRAVWTIAVAITRNSVIADDVVQDAVTVALGKLSDFDPVTSFAAWMGQIVRFVALNESRRIKKHRHAGEESLAISAAKREPDALMPELDARLLDALTSIDEVPRACFLMRTLHDMSYGEIASALSIPEGTAMSHVHRTRGALRSRLSALSPGGGA